MISPRTSGNYTFCAVGGLQAKMSQNPVWFQIPLLPGNRDVGCCIISHLALLRTEATKTPSSGLFFNQAPQERKSQASVGAQPAATTDLLFFFPSRMWSHHGLPLLSARGLDLKLISRVAGCELAFAPLPPLATPQIRLLSHPLLSRTASRRRAPALRQANAQQAALWFNNRSEPKAWRHHPTLTCLDTINLSQHFIGVTTTRLATKKRKVFTEQQ